jgi:hypothetical protein
MTSGKVIAAIAAIFTALALAGTASAQYPTPQGSLQCNAQVNVTIDGQSTVSATLRDFSGKPVSGQSIIFSIAGTPGGVSLSASSAATNANGVASVLLNAGSNAGNVTVSAIYDGLECSAVSQVAGSVIVAPGTGDAGLAAANQHATVSTALVVEVLAIVAAGMIAGLVWFKYSFHISRSR